MFRCNRRRILALTLAFAPFLALLTAAPGEATSGTVTALAGPATGTPTIFPSPSPSPSPSPTSAKRVKVWLVDFLGQPDAVTADGRPADLGGKQAGGAYHVIWDRRSLPPKSIDKFDAPNCASDPRYRYVEWVDCDPPDWPDGHTEKNWPVGYVKGSQVVLREARFKVRSDQPIQNATIVGLADLHDGATLSFVQTGVNEVNNELVITNVTSLGRLPNHVAALVNSSAMSINWTVKVGGERLSAGSSSHPVYVLYKAPTATAMVQDLKGIYLTIVDFTTLAADGQKLEPAVFGKIWEQFKGPVSVPQYAINRRELHETTGNVARSGLRLKYWTPWRLSVDEMTLSYYKKCPRPQSILDFLSEPNGVGRCGIWAPFMRDSLGVHGIESRDIQGVDNLPGFPTGPAGAEKMLIKNWSFRNTPHGKGDFPYEIRLQLLTRGSKIVGVHFLDKDFDDAPGAPGQSNPNPPGWFWLGDHAVVTYKGQIYDPSYGTGPFATVREWADASLDGYARLTVDSQEVLPEGTVRTSYTIAAHKGVP